MELEGRRATWIHLQLLVLVVVLLGFSHFISIINAVPVSRTRNLENLGGDHNIIHQSDIQNAPQISNKESTKEEKGGDGNIEGRLLENLHDYSATPDNGHDPRSGRAASHEKKD
ncbi:uncharacterized protein LOC131144946 [Malania oleifera]|uniref:uncharacterized protein LOC131144946 n=1 Tax=Malania oleifera TaxID=397392 RepID=UPI0025ADB8DC|nr:uncharacterized protein LOC131144946 [Malania oleifera]XP_057949917.1 uncharacterized protein LOC131144946 [Malania oleifera]